MNGTTQTPTKLAPAAREAREERDQRMEMMHNFDESPYTIAWEVTRACAYACAHCRADAQHKRDPRELNTEEGMRLIDGLAGFGTRPILVLTGGDPLMRRDLFEFARYADEKGLRVSLTPTATALPTRARMREAREAGIRRVAFSLDAADPEVHDRFRGFQGSFDRTFKGIENALAEGLPIQVNTTMCALNADQFEKLVPLLESVEVVQWSVFFLVPVGRGKQLESGLRITRSSSGIRRKGGFRHSRRTGRQHSGNPPKVGGVGMMTSFARGLLMTPLELAALVRRSPTAAPCTTWRYAQ